MSHLQDALRLWAAKTVEQLATGRATPGTPTPLADPSVMDVLDEAPRELRMLLLAEVAGGPHGITGAAIKTGEEEGWLTLLRDDAGEQAEPYAPSAALALAMTRARKGPVTTYEEAREYLLQLAKLLRTATAHEAHVPVPTTVAATLLEARGELLKQGTSRREPIRPGVPMPLNSDWVVYAQNGAQLVIPFDSERVEQADGTDVRLYFDGNTLRAYLATWAMLQRYRHPEGYFTWDPRWFLLEVIGAKPVRFKQRGRDYERPNPSDERALKDGLTKLLNTRITGITSEKNGTLIVRTPEPLVQQVTSPGRSGAVYYHSKLVLDSAKKNFVQVPRVVCGLHATRLPLGVGLARWWKARFDIDITRGTGASRTTLRDLLEATGERPAERARRDGRSYWTKAALQVVEVMRDGDLGEATITGEGPDAVVTLTPSQGIADAYSRDAYSRSPGRELPVEPSQESARRALEGTKRRPGRPRKHPNG